MNGKRLLPLILSAALIEGCATATKDEILPREGATMMEIYRTHMESLHTRGDPRTGFAMRPVENGSGDLSAWTRTEANEIESVFPALPNPTLTLYVFPHLSGKGYPVPGYATAFPMYESTEYALPGEVAP